MAFKKKVKRKSLESRPTKSCQESENLESDRCRDLTHDSVASWHYGVDGAICVNAIWEPGCHAFSDQTTKGRP